MGPVAQLGARINRTNEVAKLPPKNRTAALITPKNYRKKRTLITNLECAIYIRTLISRYCIVGLVSL